MYHTPSVSVSRCSVPWRGAAQDSCDKVIALVARQKMVPIRLLTHSSRSCKAAARARQIAMYLCHVVSGRSLTEIGLAFGRDRTTVSYACALIEDMRDDPRFDEELCVMEQLLELPEGEVHAA